MNISRRSELPMGLLPLCESSWFLEVNPGRLLIEVKAKMSSEGECE
jgi:hypothetical protein